MTTAGTPSLNRPLPDRSEAEARIEMALKVAREALPVAYARHADPWQTSASLAERIEQIIRILEGA